MSFHIREPLKVGSSALFYLLIFDDGSVLTERFFVCDVCLALGVAVWVSRFAVEAW